jgi:hypothetical protein
MDAIEWLERDHQKIKSLLGELLASDSAKRCRVVFEALEMEFESHRDAEERVLHPWCEGFDETRRFVEQHQRQHLQIKDRFAELSPMKDESLFDQTRSLDALLMNHMESEEQELVPAIRSVAARPERERLGRKLETAKHEFEMAA